MGELLLSLPLTDASTIKEKRDIEEPKGWLKKLQGIFTVDRDNLLKTCQGPFKKKAMASGISLPAKLGVRYFVHSYTIGAYNVAALACTGSLSLFGFVDGVQHDVVHWIQPSKDGVVNITGILDVEYDENTPVTFYAGATPPTQSNCVVAYCEVPC